MGRHHPEHLKEELGHEVQTYGARAAELGQTMLAGEQQVDPVEEEARLRAQIPEFMQTEDGKEVAALQTELDGLQATIAVQASAFTGAMVTMAQYNRAGKLGDYRKFVNDNQLGIDLKKAENDQAYATKLDKRDFDTPLDGLVLSLIKHPQFRLGSSIRVLRSAKGEQPAYLEDGWTVNRILASGFLEVGMPSGKDYMSKVVSVGHLLDWNPE
ncbi:MAG TPA: hypothetical protein VLF91_01505 [Candidatus Saccharimonadales bacterium]|nr:hypothetical protein [Candidatus Saccharimonadales bacterium]